MPESLTTIAFDADDTLWQNEQFFKLTQTRFAELLSAYADSDHLMERLLEAEHKNLGHYGFGIKGFVLSMIETALDVTNHKVPGSVISELLECGQEMLRHPIHLLPHVEETVSELSQKYRIVLITKGDLLDQERKLAQSGLGEHFDAVEIVSNKTRSTYENAFGPDPMGPKASMMVGNSLKSDVIPALAAGAWGVYVPHDLTWELEHAPKPEREARYLEVDHLGELPDLVRQITG